MSAAARRYLVRGRVQGVGFRFFVREHARRLALGGFTRNLPDGRVEVMAQGQAVALADLESQLRAGPALSRVEDVEVHRAEVDDGRDGFEVTF